MDGKPGHVVDAVDAAPNNRRSICQVAGVCRPHGAASHRIVCVAAPEIDLRQDRRHARQKNKTIFFILFSWVFWSGCRQATVSPGISREMKSFWKNKP